MSYDKYPSVPLHLIFWKSSIRNFTNQDIIDMAASARVSFNELKSHLLWLQRELLKEKRENVDC